MIRLSLKTEIGPALRRLELVQSGVRDKVLARTVNKVAQGAKTEMARAITDEFALTQKVVRDRLTINRARVRNGELEISATLFAESRGRKRSLNLVRFLASQPQFGRPKRPLRVRVKRAGGSKPVPAGFLIRRLYGTNDELSGGVFMAERIGKGRTAIAPMRTIDVPQMFNTRRVNGRVVDRIRRDLARVFAQEVRFELSRSGVA